MYIREKIPNLLTISRFFFTIAVVVLLAIPQGDNFYLDVSFYGFLAAILFSISVLTDFLDGHLSRKWMCTTTFGKIFDPLADKFLVCGTIICLMCSGSFHILAGIILVIRDILMDFLVRPALLRAEKEVGAIRSAKWKTATQMLGLLVILFFCSNKKIHQGSDGFWPPFQNENWKNWLSHSLIFISCLFSIYSFCIYLKKLIEPKEDGF